MVATLFFVCLGAFVAGIVLFLIGMLMENPILGILAWMMIVLGMLGAKITGIIWIVLQFTG